MRIKAAGFLLLHSQPTHLIIALIIAPGDYVYLCLDHRYNHDFAMMGSGAQSQLVALSQKDFIVTWVRSQP